MSRTFHNGERRIRVRGIRRDPPDLRRLARALIELAQAQAEADAQRDRERERTQARAAARRRRTATAVGETNVADASHTEHVDEAGDAA